MGTCCTNNINKANKKEPIPSKENISKQQDIENNTKVKPVTPITLDQINKSIEEWKELTKRRRTKMEENSTDRLDDEELNVVNEQDKNVEFYNLAEHSRNKLLSFDLNNEILDDFNNINKKNIFHGFSEISSTLHFTALNSKDLITSKKNFYANNQHISKSISMLNVLDELNNKQILQDNVLLGTNDKIGNSIIDNTKLIHKNSISQTQFYNNIVNINSYVIANRTHSNQLCNNELVSKDNNDALIHSELLCSHNEFIQENIFFNIEKINMYNLKKKRSIDLLYTYYFNGIYLSENPEILGNKKRIYLEEIEEFKVEWKAPTKAKFVIDKNIKNINQGIIKNCSLIASIISILNYDIKFNKNLLSSIVFPNKNNMPVISKEGFYKVKLFINGISRYLEIDDLMPFSKNKNKLLFSSSDDLLINLIEKAIFTLYNCENFTIKSNPAYEIYHLTGWIPEICLFDNMMNKSNLWNRLYTNYSEGNIILCLGTGILKEEKSYLINEHSYSVLEFKEADQKIIKCKNPWGCDNEDGIFWLDWDYIYKNFSYIFIAWNPDTYSFKYSFKSTWENYNSSSKFYDEGYSLEYNPQYLITIPEHKEDFEMRILISRYISQLNNKPRKTISYKLFFYDGYPIIYSTEHLRSLQTPFREVNSDVFIFSGSNQVDQYVLVILKCDDNNEEQTPYFLDVFSFIKINIQEIPRREFTESARYVDTWNPYKPGGNLLSRNLPNNPQYRLSLNSTNHLQIRLETNIAIPIMIMIIDTGKHITKCNYETIINNKNPGFYFNSFSYFECILEKGEYNIMCVTQDEKIIGKYCLEINFMKKSDYYIEKLNFPNLTNSEIMIGEWHKKNCFSTLYSKKNIKLFLKNPGFVIFSHQVRKVMFGLRIAKNKYNSNEFSNLGLYLIKITEDKYTIVYHKTDKCLSNVGLYSDEIEISKNETYVILCINEKNLENECLKFEFEIFSDKKIDSIQSNYSFNMKRKTFEVYGKWDLYNSGGGPQEITFFKNPQYIINVTKSTDTYIELYSHNSYSISLLIYDINEKKLIENTIYEEEMTFVKIRLEYNKKYVLIPFTKFNNLCGYFDIKISTDEDVIVKECIQKYYKDSKILYDSFNDIQNEYLLNFINFDLEIKNKYKRLQCYYFKVDDNNSITFLIKMGKEIGRMLVFEKINELILVGDSYKDSNFPSFLNLNLYKNRKYYLIILGESCSLNSFELLIESNFGSIIDFKIFREND